MEILFPLPRPSLLSLATLLYILLAAPPSYSQEDPIFLRCTGDTNYTVPSKFKSNLDLLLQSLSTVPANASRGHFQTASVDAVYGLVQCRGDVVAGDCAECLNRTVSVALLLCPLRRRVAIRFDFCSVIFSDRRFFGEVDFGPRSAFANGQDAPDPLEFDTRMMGLMAQISSQAAAANSKFAAGINYSASSVIYGLVQCTQDLSENNCRLCLQRQIGVLARGKIGAQVHVVSCYVRYENSRFFDTSVVSPSPPPQNRSFPASPPPVNVIRGGEENGDRSWKIIIGVIALLSVTVIILLLAMIIHLRRKIPKRLQLNNGQDDEVIGAEYHLFHLETLRMATANFSPSNKLGQGGYGQVYKGVLPDGQEIAVKKLSRVSEQGWAELRNEVALVAKLQHRNLVRLLGFCSEEKEKMVVYEYLPNRSLDHFLFDHVKRLLLDWERRYRLLEGIARGLVYLHEDSRLRIIHRDLKASNVLLDENMNPKIADFGIAKLFGIDETHGNTSQIAGTQGYMAPEYMMHGQFSTKSDVYSFGILTLEIVTGQRNSKMFGDSTNLVDLVSYVWHNWDEGKAHEVVDQSICDQCPRHEIIRCIHIGLLCIQSDPSSRPNMSDVVLMLSSFSMSLATPSRPAFISNSTRMSQYEESRADQGSSSLEGNSSNQSTHQPMTLSKSEITISEVEPR